MQAGDYVESQLAERMDRPKLVGDIVTHWHKYGERRKTVASPSTSRTRSTCAMSSSNPACAPSTSTATTPKPERDATLARLASGEIELVTNCMVLTEGWDMPEVGCCILARPTRKMGLYRQMIGRVLRPAPKASPTPSSSIIPAPCSGTALPRITSNGRSIPIAAPRAPTISSASEHGSASRLLECTQCGAVRDGGEPCFHCGFLPQRPPRDVIID